MGSPSFPLKTGFPLRYNKYPASSIQYPALINRTEIDVRNGTMPFFSKMGPYSGADLDVGDIFHFHIGHHDKISAV